MMKTRSTTCGVTTLAIGVATALTLPAPASAQQDDTLRVGVRRAPPFVLMEDGAWSGIAVELWLRVAQSLGRPYTFEEFELDSLLHAVSTGSADVGLGAITMTAEREEALDFTHPFHSTGLSVAVRAERGGIVRSVLDGIFSVTFLRVMGGLVLLLGIAGVLVWIFERRRNSGQFDTGWRGVGEGFWWAAVTMTTVGYGDKAPATPGGRVIAFLWMFASIMMISGFTAGIATALTVSGLDSEIGGLDDLPRVNAGTVAGSIAESELLRRGVRAETYDDLQFALGELDSGSLDAVVYDRPLLQYYARSTYHGRLRVLPITFSRQIYAIVLPDGSLLREDVNRSLLSVVTGREWTDVLSRYLGPEFEH